MGIEKNKIGRRTGYRKHNAKRRFIMLRVTDDEYEWVHGQADFLKISGAEVVRDIIDEYMNSTEPSRPTLGGDLLERVGRLEAAVLGGQWRSKR